MGFRSQTNGIPCWGPIKSTGQLFIGGISTNPITNQGTCMHMSQLLKYPLPQWKCHCKSLPPPAPIRTKCAKVSVCHIVWLSPGDCVFFAWEKISFAIVAVICCRSFTWALSIFLQKMTYQRTFPGHHMSGEWVVKSAVSGESPIEFCTLTHGKLYT